jgi:pantothenate synthetase
MEGFKVDYVEEGHSRRFGAVYLGKVRLIDNVEI